MFRSTVGYQLSFHNVEIICGFSNAWGVGAPYPVGSKVNYSFQYIQSFFHEFILKYVTSLEASVNGIFL